MGGHLPQTTILSIYPAIPASLTARESLSSVDRNCRHIVKHGMKNNKQQFQCMDSKKYWSVPRIHQLVEVYRKLRRCRYRELDSSTSGVRSYESYPLTVYADLQSAPGLTR